MIAVYKLVCSSMVMLGTKSISKACDHAFKKAGGLIKFEDESRPETSKLVDVIKTAERLRKRFHHAKKCARDQENYPSLYEQVRQLDLRIEERIANTVAARQTHDAARRDGHHPFGEY